MWLWELKLVTRLTAGAWCDSSRRNVGPDLELELFVLEPDYCR
jgi:hypothetical protein